GRDYAVVPPTRGVYRVQTESHVSVDEIVTQHQGPPTYLSRPYAASGLSPHEPTHVVPDESKPFAYYAQQMQQQQQVNKPRTTLSHQPSRSQTHHTRYGSDDSLTRHLTRRASSPATQ